MADPPDTPRRRGLVGRAVGVVAPTVMRQIDANDLVEAIDVNVIARELDLDELIDRLDVNTIANRLDLDALIDRLDVNTIANRLDLDALIDRLDVNTIANRLDLDALIDRLDIDTIANRLDLDALIDRLDLDTIANRLDLDALIDRLDLAKITAGATQDVAVTGLDLVRRQLVRADATVDSVVGGVVRREPDARPDAPGLLADHVNAAPAAAADEHDQQRRDVSGHYAGPVTRLLALTGDVFVAIGIQAALGWVAFFFLGLVFDTDTPSGVARWVGVVVFAAAFVGYFWIPVALFGRTLFMAVLGIAVVRRDGGIANGRRAFIRALLLPLSILFPFFLVGMVVGRERRTLHDATSGTVEIYDWGEREAEQPVTIRQQLSARVRRNELPRTA